MPLSDVASRHGTHFSKSLGVSVIIGGLSLRNVLFFAAVTLFQRYDLQEKLKS